MASAEAGDVTTLGTEAHELTEVATKAALLFGIARPFLDTLSHTCVARKGSGLEEIPGLEEIVGLKRSWA